MTRDFKIFLAFLFGVPVLVACLIGANFLLLVRLLHLDRDLVASAKSHIVPVAKPLVFRVDETYNDKQGWGEWLLPKLGVENNPVTIPADHPLMIDISWIQRANPYPPLLMEISEGYRQQMDYCSFGYLGVDGRYHQITVYTGETDTLPTFLVKKVRGRSTLWGDYFTQYIFLLSRETELIDQNGRPNQPQIDAIDWGSFRGGSYDGIEEIVGNAAATLVELFLIGMVGVIVHGRRRQGDRASERQRRRLECPCRQLRSKAR